MLFSLKIFYSFKKSLKILILRYVCDNYCFNNYRPTEKWLDTFQTDDVIVKMIPVIFPPGTFIGAEQVRFFVENLVADNFKMQVEILQVLGDIAITRIKTWMDATIQLGIAPNEMIVVYHIENGKIKSFTNIFTDESLAKIKAALAPK